jgi:glutamine---fructose-6-phosphate transaminase (isomerizing)
VSQLEWEISEQPQALSRALRDGAAAIHAAAAHVRRARPSYVVLAARGTSDNACRYFQHLLGRLCALPVALASSSLHTLYDADLRSRRSAPEAGRPWSSATRQTPGSRT